MRNYICVFTKNIDNYNCNLQLRELKDSLGECYVNKINEDFSLPRIDDCIKESINLGFSNFVLLSEESQSDILTDALREEYGKYFEDIYSVSERFVRLKEASPILDANARPFDDTETSSDTSSGTNTQSQGIIQGLGFTGGLDDSKIDKQNLTFEKLFSDKIDHSFEEKYNTKLLNICIFGGESIDSEFYAKMKDNDYGAPTSVLRNLDFDKFSKLFGSDSWKSTVCIGESQDIINTSKSLNKYGKYAIITPLILSSLKTSFGSSKLFNGEVLDVKYIMNACCGFDKEFSPTQDCSMGLPSYYGESSYKNGLFEISKFSYNLLENFVRSHFAERSNCFVNGGYGTQDSPKIFVEDALVCFGDQSYDKLASEMQVQTSTPTPKPEGLNIKRNRLRELSGADQFFRNLGAEQVQSLSNRFSNYAKNIANVETSKANKSVSSQKPMVTPSSDNSIKRRLGVNPETVKVVNDVGQTIEAKGLTYIINVLPSRWGNLKEYADAVEKVESTTDANSNRFLVFEDMNFSDDNVHIPATQFLNYIEGIEKIAKNNNLKIDGVDKLPQIKNAYQFVATDEANKMPHSLKSFLYSIPRRVVADVAGNEKDENAIVEGLKNVGAIKVIINSPVGVGDTDTKKVTDIITDCLRQSGNNFLQNNQVVQISSNEGLSSFHHEVSFKYDDVIKCLENKNFTGDIKDLKDNFMDNEGTFQKLMLLLGCRLFVKLEGDEASFLKNTVSTISKTLSKENEILFQNPNNQKVKVLTKEVFEKNKDLFKEPPNNKNKGECLGSTSLITEVSTMKKSFKDELSKYKTFVETCQQKAPIGIKNLAKDIGNLLKEVGVGLLNDSLDALWRDPWEQWKSYWDEQLKGTLTGALVKGVSKLLSGIGTLAVEGAKKGINKAVSNHQVNKDVKKILSDEQLEMLKNLKVGGDLGLETNGRNVRKSGAFVQPPMEEKDINKVLNRFKIYNDINVWEAATQISNLGLSLGYNNTLQGINEELKRVVQFEKSFLNEPTSTNT